jgi:hypothetical protein
MSVSRRSVVVLAPLVALMSLSVVAATRPVELSEAGKAKAAADAWVAAHRGSLPRDWEGIVKYPMMHRKAILRELSLAEKKEFWKHHLESFVLPVEHLTPGQRDVLAALPSPLNGDQQAFIRSAIGKLDLVFDPARTVDQRREVAAAFCSRKVTVLPPGDAPLILGTAGPRDTAYRRMALQKPVEISKAGIGDGFFSLIRVAVAKVGIVRAPARLAPCFCHQQSNCDCDPPNTYCVQSFPACDVGGDDCGCLGIWSCNGGACGAS